MWEFISDNLLTLIALIIAGLGGIPGFLSIINHFKTTKLIITFDENNTIACFIKSQNINFNHKLALIFYRLTITGKGFIPSYLNTIDVYLKVGFKWVKGINFHPTEYNVTDKNQDSKKSLILLNQTTNNNQKIIFLCSWIKLNSGSKQIEYGQPLPLSLASAFDIDYKNYEKCKKIKIIAKDFIKKTYKISLNSNIAFKTHLRSYLLYDNIKNPNIENVEPLK